MAKKAKRTARAHPAGKAPVRPKGTRITAAVERRVLRYLNGARIADDLRRPVQEHLLTAGEHAHDEEHIGHDEHEGPPRPRIDRELADWLMRERPLLGFTNVRDFLALERRHLLPFLKDLIWLLGPASYGEWSAAVPVEVGGISYPIQNAAMLRTGQVLLMPDGIDSLLWDPEAGANPFRLLTSAMTGLTLNLFCSGHSFLSDGRLLAAGGHGGGAGSIRSVEAWTFDPLAETWTKTAGNMAHKRWYPTLVTLGDEPGRVLVASGWTGAGTAPGMEIYSETSDTFVPVTVGGPVQKIFPQTYPGLHTLPGGEIFHAPTGFGDCSQSANPDGNTEASGYFTFNDLAAGTWTDTGPLVRTKGMSVLLLSTTYPFVQVLVIGGGTPVQSHQGQRINLSTLTPAWGPPFQLLEARIHPNVVLLPDGTVFICGGLTEAGTPPAGGRCELYDPVAGTITEMADLAYPRHYHSAALLLPSGRVAVVGGALDSGCSLSERRTIEVFSPPYLFRGARPTIASIPGLVHHGQGFDIQTPDADRIARVALVRPMAVTHQTDSEQRVIALSFHRPAPDRLHAVMPDGDHPHGLAPRGHYMLFLLDGDGVPSMAKFVFLH